MSRVLEHTDSRLAREFLLSLQRARANQETITVRWKNASVDDIANVSAFLDAEIKFLIGTGIEEMKGRK